ncbi:MAG: histidine ammonia-lyase [Patescibacteria group bacterium]|jgi:histidine ammonia-lyase
MHELEIDGHSLTIKDVYEVAVNNNFKVRVADSAREKIFKARQLVEKAVDEKRLIYGLTTGFGEFKKVAIDKDQTVQLQKNLITSHSIGVGEPFSQAVVRAAVLIRANSLAHGNSGVRLETIEALLDIINYNIYPFVPSQGSVGSSGDLAPLSHLVLCRMGLGEVLVDGQRKESGEFLSGFGLEPLILTSKEGLALNNGTAFMTAVAVLNIVKAQNLIKLADIVTGMSVEVLMGTAAACDHKIHDLRPHQGQIDSADNIRRVCANSEIMESHKHCDRVQDAYALRCSPQVHGAVKDVWRYAYSVVLTEINSVTDNPLIFPDQDEVISGGNFHGEPIAIAMDCLAIGMSELANISDRRIFRLLTGFLNEGLPAFLIPKDKGGLHNGFMIAQYTSASLVSENKVYSHPASVDSIPTSADQEDHVSMGTIAARKLIKIIDNVEQVLAIELMCATQAIDFRQPLKAGSGSFLAHQVVRGVVDFLAEDRPLYRDLEKIVKILPRVINIVEEEIGKIKV